MKKIIAIIGIFLINLPSIAGTEQNDYDWRPSLNVQADFDRNGKVDSAQLGFAKNGVGLLVTINSNPLPVIEIPIDGSKQFGICPGADPSISLIAQSDAPINALGALPQGYEMCSDCVEIVISGGECDTLQFYWNTVTDKLAWWRA